MTTQTQKYTNITWDIMLLVLAAVAVTTHKPWAFTIAVILFAITIAWRLLPKIDVDDVLDVDSTMPQPENTRAVDPWDYHRQLMDMSDQRMPRHPRMTNGSLLYAALIMEEAGETFEGVGIALALGTLDKELHKIASTFSVVGRYLRAVSVEVRAELEHVSVDFALPRLHAKELLDGTTDIAVVNSGFALSSGQPGQAAYDEVGSSNLSKANPATGKIDKDASGKWIKGVDFFKPNLDRVLDEHAR